MQQVIIKPWKKFSGSLVPEKKEKIKKKLLQFAIFKPWKTFDYVYELCSNTLSNPRGISVVLEAKKPKKMTKRIQKS